MEKIHTNHAPEAIGPYSQAVKVGNLLFTSGQIAIDPATGNIVEGGIAEQTERIMKNLTAVVEAAGGKMESIVKTTCFLADMADFGVFNEVYAKFITEKPARSCVAVKTLPKNVLAEVEVICEL